MHRHQQRFHKPFLVTAIVCISISLASAQEPFKPLRTDTPPAIDGRLDDAVWQAAPMVANFKTYRPDWSKDLSEKTEVLMAYDSENFYFAFRCYDREQDKIKSSVTSRDKMFSDDWVCINLDSFGDQQALYGFYINPLGIQGDSRATPTNEDRNFDAVWYSAGHINSEGYHIEVRIPFKSIRFSEKNPVTMGVIFERYINRRSEAGTFPPLDPAKGNSWLTQMHPMVYYDIKPSKLFEVLPAVTYTNREKADQGRLVTDENKGEFGVTTKYGITQDLILDGTYNPDFSQVEADAGQVDINLRYNLYYPEKRPFFLEGNENFSVTGCPNLIYTRTIINPLVGMKVTGKVAEKSHIASLYAMDELYTTNPDVTGRHAHFGIVRYKHALSDDGFIAALYAGKEMKQHNNRVAGIDGSIRVTPSSTFGFAGLLSYATDIPTSGFERGHKYEFMYGHEERSIGYGATFGRISDNFVAEMGYIPRPGIMYLELYLQPRLYPESELLRRVSFFLGTRQYKDLPSLIWENGYDLSVSLLLGGTVNASVYASAQTEVFLGRELNTNQVEASVSAQATNKLYSSLRVTYGNAIYYSADPYSGAGRRLAFYLRYQPWENLMADYNLTFADFYRKSDDVRIYEYTISRLKATYQLNKYLFFRGIVEYNNYRKRLLTDLLASFTYIPGTVLHLGYGSLYEKIHWDQANYIPSDRFLETKRGFFFKASYLWRL